MTKSINGANYRVDTVSQFYDLNNDNCNQRRGMRVNGSAMDWFHRVAGIIPSFTIELPPSWCVKNIGVKMFIEKEENILTIAKQLYDASVSLAYQLWKENLNWSNRYNLID